MKSELEPIFIKAMIYQLPDAAKAIQAEIKKAVKDKLLPKGLKVSVTIRKGGRHLAGQRSINVRITDGPSDLANLDYLPGFGYDISPYGFVVLEQVKAIVMTFENKFYVHDIGPDLYLHFAAQVFYTKGLLTKLREKELSLIPKTFSDTLNASDTAHIREMALKDLQVAGLYGDTLGWHDSAGPLRDAAEENAVRAWWQDYWDHWGIFNLIIRGNPTAGVILNLATLPTREQSDRIYKIILFNGKGRKTLEDPLYKAFPKAFWQQKISAMVRGADTSSSILSLLKCAKQMFPDPMHVNVEYALTQWPLVRDSIFSPSTIKGPTADYALVDDIRLDDIRLGA